MPQLPHRQPEIIGPIAGSPLILVFVSPLLPWLWGFTPASLPVSMQSALSTASL